MENGPTDANATPPEAGTEDHKTTPMQPGGGSIGDARHDIDPVVDGTAGSAEACIFLPDLSAESPVT